MKDTLELETPDEPEIKKQNTEPDGTRRELDGMPCDHATGDEVLWDGEWWNEYVDSKWDFHYGR